jgi:hypothetical protein
VECWNILLKLTILFHANGVEYSTQNWWNMPIFYSPYALIDLGRKSHDYSNTDLLDQSMLVYRMASLELLYQNMILVVRTAKSL